MPFTETQFLDVFETFNLVTWPFVAVLWIGAAWFAGQLVGARNVSRSVRVFAAVLWAWTGIGYHAVYFTRVNPAAWLFAALFLIEAAGFLWWARHRDDGPVEGSHPGALAIFFLAYALLYPGLVVLTGHAWPRGPVFGVPCPVALFTTGILLAARPAAPRWLLIVPILWALVGGTAAFLFGMTPDLMLFVAAGALVWEQAPVAKRGKRLRVTV
jgi:hypothetical protein